MTLHEQIVTVLAAHRKLPFQIKPGTYQGCSCGWVFPEDKPVSVWSMAWERHRAQEVLAVLPPEPRAFPPREAPGRYLGAAPRRNPGLVRRLFSRGPR